MIQNLASFGEPAYPEYQDIRLKEEGAIHLREDDPFVGTVIEDRLSSAQRANRDKSFARIAPLLQRQPEIFDHRKRGKIISEIVAANNESRHSLGERLLREFQLEAAR